MSFFHIHSAIIQNEKQQFLTEKPVFQTLSCLGLYQAKPRRNKPIDLIYIIQVFWPYVDITYRFGFLSQIKKKSIKLKKVY